VLNKNRQDKVLKATYTESLEKLKALCPKSKLKELEDMIGVVKG